jgi:hypothetical protein
MPRATQRLTFLLALTALMGAASAFAETKAVNNINGIGLVDYTRKPDFKVGSWVRYHTVGSSLMGARDDYRATVLIAGEERFWGEDGFWVETWNEVQDGKSAKAVATLMSYAIFQDSLPIPRMQLYMRKSIGQVDDEGRPLEELLKRPPSSLKTRKPIGGDVHFAIDTLGTDTVQTVAGDFRCQMYKIRQGTAVTQELGDSTIYTEVREDRVVYMALNVPITHIVREDIDYSIHRRAWRAGRSQDSVPMLLLERSQGTARLEGMGEGLKGRVLPLARQKSLAEWFPPTPPKSSKPATTTRSSSKPATSSSGGSR